MYRWIRFLHLLGFGALLGGLAGVAGGADIARLSKILGLGVATAVVTGIVMIASTKGRALKQGWLRAHLIGAALLGPVLFMTHERARADDGATALAAVIVVIAIGLVASLKPRFSK